MLFSSSIVCPEEESPYPVTFWTIMSKVRVEAFMWVGNTFIGPILVYTPVTHTPRVQVLPWESYRLTLWQEQVIWTVE